MKNQFNKAKLNNYGFSMVELCVFLAVTAIIAIMVSSFSILVSFNITKTKFNASVIEEVNTIKSNFCEFLDTFDNKDYSITITNDKISAVKDENTYSLYIKDGYLLSTDPLPTGKKINYKLQEVISIDFINFTVGEKCLAKMNITCYKTSERSMEKTQQFEFVKYQYTENITGESL